MTRPTLDKPRAEDAVGQLLTDDEVVVVLDALANGSDPADCLEEWRYWRSPQGREAARADAFDSGRQ